MTKECVRFPASMGIRLVVRLGTPFLLFVFLKAQSEAGSTFSRVVFEICGVAAVAAFFLMEPLEIRVQRTGITQSGLFGLRKRHLAWDGLVASYTPQLQRVRLIANNGLMITHTQYHDRQAEFVNELRSHNVFFHGDQIL